MASSFINAGAMQSWWSTSAVYLSAGTSSYPFVWYQLNIQVLKRNKKSETDGGLLLNVIKDGEVLFKTLTDG